VSAVAVARYRELRRELIAARAAGTLTPKNEARLRAAMVTYWGAMTDDERSDVTREFETQR
jgi:hypothetical protein